MIKETITLFFKEGTSDKFYTVSIQDDKDGTYSVPFTFGRRGTSGQSGLKISGVTEAEAQAAYDKTVKEKLAKGYSAGNGIAPYAGISSMSEKKQSGITPQLLNFISEKEALQLCSNKAYCAQEKKDGRRMILKFSRGIVTAINKKGFECGFPTRFEVDIKLMAGRAKLGDLIFDGEAVGETYYVFDLLNAGQDVRHCAYKDRYTRLTRLPGDDYHALKLLPLSKTTAEKTALLESLLKNHKEGVVFKKLDASYKSGRPASGGDQLKFKFFATATCRVSQMNAKNSISLTMFIEHGSWQSVGNCTISQKDKEKIKEGMFVEIKYLYAFKGGSLFQPSFIGVRDDADESDCQITQLKYKAEEDDE